MNLDNVVETLEKEGLSEKQIGEFVVNLNNLVAQKVHVEIMSALTEEDLAEVETATDAEANETISRLYEHRTGSTVDELGDQALDGFVETFLANYEVEKSKEKDKK